MRKIVVLAVMLIAPGMAPQSAEAADRRPGFGNFPPHSFSQPHFARHGSRSHGGHFGPPRHFQPRHFGHFGGSVLRFHNRGLGFRFGNLPHVRPPHFARHHRAPFLTFGHLPQVSPWGFSQRHHQVWRGPPPRRR